ncbi:MAG: type II secretion system protein [Pseudomonadales bacterium]|nr:type II secretion system protein [Candidatus Woesebacteria bacterium]MCB9802316.1 type II secretion system protein [Pseudomonadales bacterium]
MKFLQKLRKQAGFTMIELLIVISILGILAVAVLAAINPVEQINRGRDTSSQSDAEQLISAVDRYNAFKGYYPWLEDANDTANPVSALVEIENVDDGAGCSILEKLAGGDGASCDGTDELKSTFITRVSDPDARPLYVYNEGGTGDATYVCFEPQSQAFKTQAIERCDAGLPGDVGQTAESMICDDGNELICLP